MLGIDPLTTILGAAIGALIAALGMAGIIKARRADRHFSILLFSILIGAIPISVGSKTPNLYFSDLIVLLLLARLLIHRLLGLQDHDSCSRSRFETDVQVFALVAVLYFLSVLGSTWISPDPLRSMADIKVLMESFAIFLLVWLSLRDDPEAIQNVLRTTTLFGLAIAIVALVTTYHACQGQWGLVFTWAKSYEIKQMIRSWIGGSNYLGGILAILLPIAVVNSALARGLHRLSISASSVVMLAAIYVTSSKGAMLSLILGTFLATLLSLSWRIKLLAGFITLMSGVVVLLHPEFWTEIYVKYLYSLHRREEALWLEGWKALIADPLLGIGRGISRTLFGRPLHNSILTAFVESGVLAGTLFIFLLVLILRRSVLASRRTRGNRDMSVVARGLQISVTVGVIHSLGEILLEATAYAIVFWLFVGMLYALPLGRDETVDSRCLTVNAPDIKSPPRNRRNRAAQPALSGERPPAVRQMKK